jgi:hypothetical protein
MLSRFPQSLRATFCIHLCSGTCYMPYLPYPFDLMSPPMLDNDVWVALYGPFTFSSFPFLSAASLIKYPAIPCCIMCAVGKASLKGAGIGLQGHSYIRTVCRAALTLVQLAVGPGGHQDVRSRAVQPFKAQW